MPNFQPFINRTFAIRLILLAGLLMALLPGRASATEEYARQTGKGCIFCHRESIGGPLGTVGFAYIRNGYRYPISQAALDKSTALQTPVHQVLRFLIGYLHLVAAVIFFGAIFYIHIFVRPTRLTGGIPKPERILGLSCMVVLTLTGGYLSWMRIDRWEQFFNNTFGLMLFIKILLFILMATIGLFAVTLIHGRLKAEGRQQQAKDGEVTQKVFVVMAYTNLVIIFLILGCIGIWRWNLPWHPAPETRAEIVAGNTCVECHRLKTPGIFRDWQAGIHATVGVGCHKCHRPNNEQAVLTSHLAHDPRKISAVVSPVNCGGCHPKEAQTFAASKHANTNQIIWQIDFWLQDGMNNTIERTTGCFACHGTVVSLKNGKPVSGWPNVGVGRINPDGSKGSCSSCHTRHRFSIAEARKPEACGQCHLGPDHPQMEIYDESKHGAVYHAEGPGWNWDPDDRDWRAGRDFRTPTCASCHLSTAGTIAATHDVTERLSWETQAPLTIRPADFAPFPAAVDWRTARGRMEEVCRQCHSEGWVTEHFRNLDDTVKNYNEEYYLPVKKVMDDLYEQGKLSRQRYFDEPLEWEFYEFWHHEGRRARMGAAMMAPDYAWWHGFYEMKRRFNHILTSADDLRRSPAPSVTYPLFPGRFNE